jgi:DNA-binding NtrC family response regulator
MNETILLVDDELLPRTFARDALQACGYTVLDTDEPQEALQIMRDQPVHLLVVDVVMPLMRGTELADRAQAIRPSLKVLLVSGYPTSDIGPSGRPFLAKPFRIETLTNVVRDVLASPSAFARPRRGP